MSKNRVLETSQYIDNLSFDDQNGLAMVELVGTDGAGNIYRTGVNPDGTLRSGSAPKALKTQVVGSVTYLAVANVGTPQSSAAWQARKIDQSSGTVISWADGDANFDNVATDLTLLSYS